MTTYVRDYTALMSDPTDRWNAVASVGTATVVTYSFMTALPSYASRSQSFRPLSAAEQNAARLALRRWSEACGITFVETPDSSATELRFGWIYENDTWTGAAYLPSYSGGTYSAASGDIFFNRLHGSSIVEGEYYFQVALHEIGHAIGLKHPFEGAVRLETAVDTQDYTVMSYTRGNGIKTNLMPLDMDAGRHLYGAAGAGITASYADGRTTITVTGAGGRVVGSDGRDVMVGSPGADWLYGNGGDDALQGNDGDDRLYASPGAATLSGGAGADWGELSSSLWTGSTCLVSGVETLVGGAGRDRATLADGGNRLILAAIETLVGGSGQDWIDLGNRGNTLILTAIETLVGGSGRDSVTLGNRGNTLILAGVETLTSGTGADWVTLGNRGNTMALSGIETLVGGSRTDDIQLTGYGNSLVLAGIEVLRGNWGDYVRLGNRGSTMTVQNVATLVGGAQRDEITVRTQSSFDSALRFEGGGGDDRLILAAGSRYDTVVFLTARDGSAAGAATGFDEVDNFGVGMDVVAIAGELRSAVDRNGNGLLTATSRATGSADAARDELVVLGTTVSNLADAGFASLRSALGTVATDGAAHSILVLGSDGRNSGLYVVAENGDGAVGAGEVSLLARFNGSLLTGGSVFLSSTLTS